MIKKLLHVAIAVKSTAEWESLLRDQLGLKVIKSEDVPAQGVKGTIFAVGDSEIETLEPIDPQGTVARFVERRG
ncbi:MAG: methylmalonyl-CoA epimerase, partial [Chloroflexi bacterium]|nr:methylmalonyl-CoA epimerase [Chloroflexota bacterium]